MKMNITTYQHAGGFGFQVESDDGQYRVRSDYKPRASGNVPMTEAEALDEAQAEVALMTGEAPAA